MTTVPTAGFDFFSVTEAAAELDLTVGRVRQLLLAGEIQGHKLGEKQWAISRAEVEKQKRLRAESATS